MDIVEAVLGVKEHESTKQYADPETLLVPMFYQVVGMLFRLIVHYHDYISKVDGIRPVPRRGDLPAIHPAPLTVAKEGVYTQFRAKYDEFVRGKATFLAELVPKLDQVYALPLAEFSFPLELWVQSVYRAINAFAHDDDLKILDALRVLWQGRFLSLVRETEKMTDEEAERYIQDQLKVFAAHRRMLA